MGGRLWVLSRSQHPTPVSSLSLNFLKFCDVVTGLLVKFSTAVYTAVLFCEQGFWLFGV